MQQRQENTDSNYAKADAFINISVKGKDDTRSFKKGIYLYASREMDKYLMDNPTEIQKLFSKKVEATLVFANGSKDTSKPFVLA